MRRPATTRDREAGGLEPRKGDREQIFASAGEDAALSVLKVGACHK